MYLDRIIVFFYLELHHRFNIISFVRFYNFQTSQIDFFIFNGAF